MYGFDIENHYKHDGVFRRVVDQLRSLLSAYHVTPGELREAVILAATMHEAENIRPLYIRKDDIYGGVNNAYAMMAYAYPTWDNRAWVYNAREWDIPEIKKVVECNCTKDLGKDAPPTFKCICDCTPHTKTCNDYNWAYYHQVDTLAKHTFGKVQGFGDQTYRPCLRCNLSDVFIKHFKVTECLASSPTKS